MSTNPGPIAPADEGGNAPAIDQAKEQVQDVAERAQAAVGDAATKADVKVREQIDQRSTEAGSQLSASADALRSSSNQLRTQGNAVAAQVAERAADQAHRLGAYLEQTDADRMLEDAERLARRNPWAVVVGGVLVGAAASRFLKASSDRRSDSPSSRQVASAPPAPVAGEIR
jgi:uncharacterized protein with LGFP repeats